MKIQAFIISPCRTCINGIITACHGYIAWQRLGGRNEGWGGTYREGGKARVNVPDSLDAGAGAQVARPGQRDAHDGHRDGAQRSDRLQLPAYAGASARHSPFCGACLPAAEESVHTLAGTVCACLVQADLKVCDSLRASMCGRSAPEGNSDIASMLGPIKVQLSLAPGL